MKHRIYVVGMGPGQENMMTQEAMQVLEASDVIIGYTVYVDLVKEYFAGKEFMTTPMKKEVDRCVLAFEEAKKGKTVFGFKRFIREMLTHLACRLPPAKPPKERESWFYFTSR